LLNSWSLTRLGDRASSPSPIYAGIAQLVEQKFSKLNVVSSQTCLPAPISTTTKRTTMTKQELIKKLADISGTSNADAERNLLALINIITKQLFSGGELQIAGLGKFSLAYRKERNGVNPKTGEKIIITAARLPKFKAAKALKDAVGGG
jgi:DNA-binding protein HU-beta